jgi:hypothetical protein
MQLLMLYFVITMHINFIPALFDLPVTSELTRNHSLSKGRSLEYQRGFSKVCTCKQVSFNYWRGIKEGSVIFFFFLHSDLDSTPFLRFTTYEPCSLLLRLGRTTNWNCSLLKGNLKNVRL